MSGSEDDMAAKRAALAQCKAAGEKAYDDMYEVHSFEHARICFREAKESFEEAIALATALGMPGEAEALAKRLAHITAVFRSQFVQR